MATPDPAPIFGLRPDVALVVITAIAALVGSIVGWVISHFLERSRKREELLMTMHKEVYLPCAEALSRLSGILAAYAELNNDEKELKESLLGALATLARLQPVSDVKTFRNAMALQRAVIEVNVVVQRERARKEKYQREIVDAAGNGIQLKETDDRLTEEYRDNLIPRMETFASALVPLLAAVRKELGVKPMESLIREEFQANKRVAEAALARPTHSE